MVDMRMVSPTRRLMNIREIKGEKKIRVLILAVLRVSFRALSQSTNVMPISKMPTYTAPKRP
jgi:hypothetical protein